MVLLFKSATAKINLTAYFSVRSSGTSMEKHNKILSFLGWKTYAYEKCLLLSTRRKDENRISLVECLYKFFKCYHKLDFDTYVICPYLGKLIPKEDFKNFGEALKADIPDYYESVSCQQGKN